MTVCPNIPRITIPNVLYTIRRPPWRTGIILIAIPGNTSPNLENRELTGGYGALRYPRWRLDVERFIMQRTIERRYTIIQCVLGKGKYQFCTDSIDQRRREFQLPPSSYLLSWCRYACHGCNQRRTIHLMPSQDGGSCRR